MQESKRDEGHGEAKWRSTSAAVDQSGDLTHALLDRGGRAKEKTSSDLAVEFAHNLSQVVHLAQECRSIALLAHASEACSKLVSHVCTTTQDPM